MVTAATDEPNTSHDVTAAKSALVMMEMMSERRMVCVRRGSFCRLRERWGDDGRCMSGMWQPRGEGNGDNSNAKHHLSCPDSRDRGSGASDRYTKAQRPDPARYAMTVRP